MAEFKRAFVCGFPINHTRSPMIHNQWLKRYGIAGSYEAIAVEPGDFQNFIASLRERQLVGGNVTIPHKESAFALVQRRDAAADAIGAVNTLWFEEGELIGGNSDAYGFAANLDDLSPGWDQAKSAVVLGAGGAARAIIHALLERGIRDIRIANRTLSRAGKLADHFSGIPTAHELTAIAEISQGSSLLINTSSIGMGGKQDHVIDLSALAADAVVSDIVYVPLETPLLKAAKERGLRAVDGLGMLLHQAVPGFERWFGHRPTVDAELRAPIEADVKRQQ